MVAEKLCAHEGRGCRSRGQLEGLEATRQKWKKRSFICGPDSVGLEFLTTNCLSKEATGNRDEAFQFDERAQQFKSADLHSVQTEIINLRNQVKTLEENAYQPSQRQELENAKEKMAVARSWP